MDKDYCTQEGPQPEQVAGLSSLRSTSGTVRMPAAVELLYMKIKELRDEAFKLEALARELQVMPLSGSVQDTLATKLSHVLFRH